MNRLEEYRGTRVAVLGASGFLGRWIAKILSNHGASVYLFVREKARAQEIFTEFDVRGETIAVDLANGAKGLVDLFQAIRPYITFNAAGYGIDRSERDEDSAYTINVDLVTAACNAIAVLRTRDWPGQDLVHVGSALEYGVNGDNLAEDSEPQPTTLYGKSKLAGTQALTRCTRASGLKGLTARLFALYGPGEHDGRLLPSLIQCAETGESLEMTAGTQRRDFTYVEDAAEGLLRLGLSEAPPGSIVNLATGKLTSVRSFVETAAGLLSIPSERLRFGALPLRPEEMAHAPVSIERLRQITGWTPPTDIAEGISKTLRVERTSGTERIL